MSLPTVNIQVPSSAVLLPEITDARNLLLTESQRALHQPTHANNPPHTTQATPPPYMLTSSRDVLPTSNVGLGTASDVITQLKQLYLPNYDGVSPKSVSLYGTNKVTHTRTRIHTHAYTITTTRRINMLS